MVGGMRAMMIAMIILVLRLVPRRRHRGDRHRRELPRPAALRAGRGRAHSRDRLRHLGCDGVRHRDLLGHDGHHAARRDPAHRRAGRGRTCTRARRARPMLLGGSPRCWPDRSSATTARRSRTPRCCRRPRRRATTSTTSEDAAPLRAPRRGGLGIVLGNIGTAYGLPPWIALLRRSWCSTDARGGHVHRRRSSGQSPSRTTDVRANRSGATGSSRVTEPLSPIRV